MAWVDQAQNIPAAGLVDSLEPAPPQGVSTRTRSKARATRVIQVDDHREFARGHNTFTAQEPAMLRYDATAKTLHACRTLLRVSKAKFKRLVISPDIPGEASEEALAESVDGRDCGASIATFLPPDPDEQTQGSMRPWYGARDARLGEP